MPGYANPQNLNRYSYVLNNPLRYTNPTGHRCVEVGFEGSCSSVEDKTTQKWHDELKEKKEKSDEKKRHDIIRRGAEFAFGAVLAGVGAIGFVAGSFVVGAAVVEAIGEIATGPGELLAVPHAVAVGSFALFVMLPVSGFLVGAGIRTMHNALTP